MKKIVFKILKITAWFFGSIAALLLLISILIQFPSIQNKIVSYAVDYLEQKIETPVSLQRIEISFPKKIVLKEFELIDQQNDTLVRVDHLAVDISLLGLLSNQIKVSQVELFGLHSTVKVDSTGRANYQYIVDAFQSEEELEEPSSSSMHVSVGGIALENIYISYHDAYQGNSAVVQLDEFQTHFRNFDLDKFKFALASTQLKGLDTKVTLFATSPYFTPEISEDTATASSEQESSSLLPTLDLGIITLEDIVVDFEDQNQQLSAFVDLKYFQSDIPLVDLNNQKVDISSILLEKLTTEVAMNQPASSVQNKDDALQEQSVQQEQTTAQDLGWEVDLKDLSLASIDIKFDNNSLAKLPFGLDTNHIAISDLNFDLSDFRFSNTNISGHLQHFGFKESSGFDLRKVKGYFLYSEQSAFLKDFVLQTSHSEFNSSVVLNYTSLQDLSNNLGQSSVDIQIKNSFIGLGDIDLLSASFVQDRPLATLSNNRVDVEVVAKGRIDDLQVDTFFLRTLESTFVSATAHLKGATDPIKGKYTLAIKDFQTSAKDLDALGAAAFLPQDIALPALMKLKGAFEGGISNFTTNMQLQTSVGNVEVKGHLNQVLKDKEAYSFALAVDNLQLGVLTKNDSIGALTLRADVNGSSFNPQLSEATASFTVQEFGFNGHVYQDLFVKAALDKGLYQLHSTYDDPSLDYELKASGLWTEQSLSLNLDSDFRNVDFHGLKLVEEPLAFASKLKADMPNILPDSLQGNLRVEDLNVLVNQRVVAFEPIVLSANASQGYRDLILKSQLIDFDMKGDYSLTTLSQAIRSTLSGYFDHIEEPLDASKDQSVATKGQYFDYSLAIKDSPLIQNLVVDLKSFEPITIQGSYVQEKEFLSMKAQLPKIQYGDNAIEKLSFDLQTTQDALMYNLAVGRMYNASLGLRGLSLHGSVKDNALIYNFDLRDSSNKLCYTIAAELKTQDKVLTHRILPNGFMLDYVPWSVDPNNLIAVSGQGIYANDFVLSLGDNTSIKMQSAEQTWQSPLTLDFENFSIASLTTIIKKDKLLADGVVNGFLTLTDLSKDLRFVSNIDITDLHALELPLGDLHLGMMNESLSKYMAKVELKGNDNDVALKGMVDFDTSELKMLLDVDKLQMGFFERFAEQAISNTSGYFTGKINIDGAIEQPSILGKLDFVDIGMHVNTLQADFTNINERISFTPKGIEFNTFSITDSDGNLLVIDGQILTTTYKDFRFNIDIKAIDFKAMSSTAKDNDMYYGDLVFDSNIKIRGDLDKPIVNGSISVGKQTDFTVIMPQEDPALADREGIVEFVDQQSLMLAQTQELQQSLNNSAIKGLDVSLAISVDKQAVFNLLMDKQSGDNVVMKGEADLVGGIDPSGKITLAGRYEFDQGSYDFSFNLIKRNFRIQKGSYIVFAGDPTDAQLNMTAIYEVNTAPLDLLQSQLSSLSPTQLNMYKQKIPFEALLKINGELLEPEISFDITLKDDITSVSGDVISNTNTKLAQLRQNETEMNKQVFALLLLNHFIGENPFESSSGGMTAGSIARQSVNKILSDQLNSLADNLIQGVELNFNLESSDDFSTGNRQTRTDLNVAVSKRLFSDRLKVSVGSNFEVEGAQRENEQAANIAGDIELEYALTQDGRYLVRVYRKNRYEVALQAQVVETGVGFVITMSYTHFRELFEKSKNKRELKKQLKNESQK